MWITFKRPGKDWQDAPGYFFEIAPDHYCYGMGYYEGKRATMDAFRATLETRPHAFRQLIAPLSHFTVGGDQYKKTLNPAIPPDLQPWYQRKSFYLLRTFPIEEQLFAADFPVYLAAEFQLLAPLYRFMWALKRK